MMRFLSIFQNAPQLLRLNSHDAAQLSSIHAQSFYHAWDEASLQGFLSDPQVIGFGVQSYRKKRAFSGFILARLIEDEAEILTFAVAPNKRRYGLGRKLLEHLLRFLYKERAKVLFLEVDETNHAAIALYQKLGFIETGRRKAYYQAIPASSNFAKANQKTNRRTDAVLFEYRLKQPQNSTKTY